MKSIQLIVAVFVSLCCTDSLAQTHNSVKTWVAQKPISTEIDLVSSSRTIQEVQLSTHFFDGFGRNIQSVRKQTSPLQKDGVYMHLFDALGRETKKYLPFVAGNDGLYKNDALTAQTTFNQGLYPGEANFYTQVDLENSPQSRTLKSYKHGSSWVGNSKGATVRSVLNTIADNVRIWNIAATAGSIPTSSGYYTAGQLNKTIGTNEEGNQAIQYTDKDGNVILKKVQYSTASTDDGTGSPHLGWLCTYYVYDDFGRQRFVIPPKVVGLIDGSWTITQQQADDLCYRFEFDDFDRVIIARNPGTQPGTAGEVWTVFDQRGRVVLSQDGNLRFKQKWQYFLYDSQDRPVATGLISDPSNYNNRSYHQTAAASSSAYPNTASYTTELLTQVWYDDYTWVAASGSGLDATLDATNTSNTNIFYAASNSSAPYPQAITQTVMTRGMVTGSKSEVLESNGSKYLHIVTFYDDKGRVIQTQGNNITNGVDKVTTQFSWAGLPLRIYEQQIKKDNGDQSTNVLSKMSYDHGGRITGIVKNMSTVTGGNTINSGDRTVATYTYKETSQLNSKTLGTNLETLNFEFNVQGWNTGINKNFTIAGNSGNWFGMEVGYDKTSTTTGTTSFLYPSINGSASGQVWRSRGDGVPRKYDFRYDRINQLTSAAFQQNTNGSSWDNSYMDYSVNSMTYDLNGNIKGLNQNGFVLGGQSNIDNLTYNYENADNSNRLKNVVDNANNPDSKLGDFHYAAVTKTAATIDYGYDYNGNLTSDVNKGISSITYNYLNLPNVITFAKGTITFQYDASGRKHRKTVLENNASVVLNGTSYTTNITTITTYIGGFVYLSKAYSNATVHNLLKKEEALLFASHEEGRSRLKPSENSFVWVFDYFIRDNLGNIRMTLTDEQQTDYYPAATLETAGLATEQSYYNIKDDAGHIVTMSGLSWYSSVSNNTYNNNSNSGLSSPPDPTVNPAQASTKMYKLNGATGDKFGMGIALKVMAGDALQVFGRSLWHNPTGTVNNNTHLVSSVLSAFVDAFAGTNAVKLGSKGAATGTLLNSNLPTTSNLTSILNNSPVPASTPRANISWILFDEQFKPVAAGSGFDAISTTADVFKNHAFSINVEKSGYLYIYCSNESNWDVYFDNLQVAHTKGRLLNETHFYPDGLTMYALNSRAFGKLQTNFGYQGKELQQGEFYDGSGLEEYDFAARFYDPQLARWHSQDPANQYASPYRAMGNNWPNTIDPTGKWAGWDDVIVAGIGFITGYVMNGIMTNDWGWKSVQAGLISAASFMIGYYTGGAGGDLSKASIAQIFSAGNQSHANTVALRYAGGAALTSAVGSLMPGINIPIGNNFSIGVSPALGMSGGSLTTGVNFSVTYKGGDWVVTGGAGIGSNATSYGGGATYDGFGGSYARNAFKGEHAQISATIGIYGFGASLRIDEDYLGDGQDRWRTGAVEIGYLDYTIGFSVYTNDGLEESGLLKNDRKSKIHGANNYGKGAWAKGEVYSSPAWVGYRQGNQIHRVGYNFKQVQDLIQNGLHTWKKFSTPYYLDYNFFQTGVYTYFGYYDPFTLY